MKQMITRWLLAVVVTYGLVLTIVLPASAACEACFEIELADGTVKQICIPLCYIEVHLFDIPRYAEREVLHIPEVVNVLEETILAEPQPQPWAEALLAGPDPVPWLLVSPTGEHILALDVENELLIEIPAEVGIR
ncbi:MAG: hypothetical protein GFH27_549311n67 [Chloroflexi bacterium AL-W]|nr:hypothetical protein [Chloroflexi bacterium AL-N1]NOK68755.1 hypothetical protein [Chloroflexi bacterium AL-N10]NOK76241.1 hypothetical protein [Chloroflexi bacterium AL-N5]NOK84122.1 hypothetical protein [Chloroflexi bacterium AL-W]NOK91379.1 hypothetical protein [Chloroflexi bacterium AL-N15]